MIFICGTDRWTAVAHGVEPRRFYFQSEPNIRGWLPGRETRMGAGGGLGLESAAGVGMGHGDGFEAAVAAHGLVGADLIESPPVGAPSAFVVFEHGRRVPALLEELMDIGVEIHAHEGQKAAGSAVAGPEDIVAPAGVVPAEPFAGIDPSQGGEEPGLQVLSMAVEGLARLVDLQVFEEEAERPAQNAPRREDGEGKDAGPDQPSHCSNPRPDPWTRSPERAL